LTGLQDKKIDLKTSLGVLWPLAYNQPEADFALLSYMEGFGVLLF
jgi:hypothetical protein